MNTKRAYYLGLIQDGPIFQAVSEAFDAIDDEWFALSKTCPKTITAAASGGFFKAGYPLEDLTSALYHPYMETTPGMTPKRVAMLRFFRSLLQYEGRGFKLPQKNPYLLDENYRVELLDRLYDYALKLEFKKYAKVYKKHRDIAVESIAPLCADTDLFNPARACRIQEARNVWATDVMTGLSPIWGKFKHIRPVTKLAMLDFRSVIKHWG